MSNPVSYMLPVTVVENQPRIPWKEITRCTHYGLPKEFEGLVHVAETGSIYYMTHEIVLYLSHISNLRPV